jgi:glycosyltransferase involved in cell wall biosynthesis
MKKIVHVKFGVSVGYPRGGVVRDLYAMAHGASPHLNAFHSFYDTVEWFKEMDMDVEGYDTFQRPRRAQWVQLIRAMTRARPSVDPFVAPDVVAARNHFPWDLVPAARLARHHQVPLVTWIHSGPLARLGAVQAHRFPIIASLRLIGLVMAIKRSDAIAIVGAHTADTIRRVADKFNGGKCPRIYVCPNGFDYQAAEQARTFDPPEDDRRFVGYVGQAISEKGFGKLKQAFNLVSFRNPSARLRIIGHGFGGQGVWGNHKAGQMDPTDPVAMMREIRRCTIMVNLSPDETFGSSVLESTAAGRCTITRDIPAFRNMAGTIRITGSVEDYAGAILGALDRPPVCPDLEDLRPMSWDRVLKNEVDMYSDLCERR